MTERRYLSEMTAAQAAASIESALDKVSKDLDQISVLEWDSQPVRDMRNREQELHSALVVLRDMESNQGAFELGATALEAPAAPAPAQVQALHRARRALHAIGKTYDDSELRTRALEADEEIDRMLAAAPQEVAAPVVAAMSQAARDVLAERSRQVEAEGWTPGHDDEHDKGEMAVAAALYALQRGAGPALWIASSKGNIGYIESIELWLKPCGPRRSLEKAGALILAEMERMDRAARRMTQMRTPSAKVPQHEHA